MEYLIRCLPKHQKEIMNALMFFGMVGVAIVVRGADVTNWVANPAVRIVNGQQHDITDPIWQSFRGKLIEQRGALILVQPMVRLEMTGREREEAKKQSLESLNSSEGAAAASSNTTPSNTKLEFGETIAVTNYDGPLSPHGMVTFKAVACGSMETSSGQMQLVDCGVPALSQVVTSSTAQPRSSNAEPPGEVASIMRKATSGDSFFQIVLAEHYRDGNGVPRDLIQAKFWAECACTNHEADATNLLNEINKRMGHQIQR